MTWGKYLYYNFLFPLSRSCPWFILSNYTSKFVNSTLTVAYCMEKYKCQVKLYLGSRKRNISARSVNYQVNVHVYLCSKIFQVFQILINAVTHPLYTWSLDTWGQGHSRRFELFVLDYVSLSFPTNIFVFICKFYLNYF